ncbi:DUF7169 domain-containing protein [Crossiella sp. CA198]|uniref:DUF7169 domain-containing protein n=1 Tax=Crossiella sp. CA198 TaxID=3455607 RepID=UPI003F8CF461
MLRSACDLDNVLQAARQVQWEPAPTAQADTDGRRSQGGHNDPTATAALDERRLRLRAAVQAVEGTLLRSAVAFASAREELQDALAVWQKP